MADIGEVTRFYLMRCMGSQIFSSLLGCELDPAFFLAHCPEVLETQQDEQMVGTAAGANLKGLEEKHSLGMWRRQIGRILEKGWQEGRLHSMSKRWRGS